MRSSEVWRLVTIGSGVLFLAHAGAVYPVVRAGVGALLAIALIFSLFYSWLTTEIEEDQYFEFSAIAWQKLTPGIFVNLLILTVAGLGLWIGMR